MNKSTKEDFKKLINKINKSQFTNMTGFVSNGKKYNSESFEWEDKSLFKYVDLEFEKINVYNRSIIQKDNSIDSLIEPINNLINQFNNRKINYKEFFKSYNKLENNIKQALEDKDYSVHFENFDIHFKESSCSSIKGVGGLGKSYFLWECQKKIQTAQKYESLFIYGKFFKDIGVIPWDNIVKYAKLKEFLLVIDGVNEISDKDQRILLYEKIKELKKCGFARIFISYRTFSLTNLIDGMTEEQYIDQLMGNTIYFQGVNFDSSIYQIIKNYKIDFSYYYHILYTNNPMQIKMIIEGNIFNDSNLIDKFKNLPIISITTIYERYILSACRKLWKSNKDKYWKEIKSICKKMYDSNRHFFTKEDFSSKKIDFNQFVNDLKNGGYLSSYDDNKYFFSLEQLSNYLIARSFHDEIKGKTVNEVAQAYILKASSFSLIKQILLSVVIEKYHDDYKEFIEFLKKIKPEFTYETLSNIVITDISIRKEIQKYIKIENPFNLFSKLGGLPNRLFNCESYFFDYILQNKIKILKPGIYSDKAEIVRRLKCILHNINGKYFVLDNAMEFFKFACVCLLIPDETINNLSEKIILDLMEYENVDFKKIILSIYKLHTSPLLKRAIYNILCHLSAKNRLQYNSVLKQIAANKNFINAKILTNYSKLVLLEPFAYVKFNKINLYRKYESKIDDIAMGFEEYKTMGGIIGHIRLSKLFYSLNIENYNELKLNFKLLNLDKKQILSFNKICNVLVEKYNKCNCSICVDDNYFSESIQILKNQLFPYYDLIDQNKLLFGFIYHLKKQFEYYGITDDDIKWYKDKFYSGRYSIYPDNVSVILSVAVEEYIGSLMCNYFNDDCAISYWQDTDMIYLGFKPIEYDEEQASLSSPLSSYNEDIHNLDSMVIERLNNSYKHKRNKKWADNKKLSLKNCRDVLKPYILNKKSWILLSAYISPHYYNDIKKKNRDYSEECLIIHCATHYNKNKNLTVDRYKTIEIQKYIGTVFDYDNLDSDFCKNINSIKDNTDVFDETNLVFPPSFLIKYLKLHYDAKISAWVDKNLNIVILCNNDVYYRYEDYIGHSIYINKDYLDANKTKLQLYYYIYTEKVPYDTGCYSSKSDMHLLIKNGKILKCNMNTGGRVDVPYIPKKKCVNCPIYQYYTKRRQI